MNLAEKYPIEQARLRELLEVYKEIGPVGNLGHVAISVVLADADRAAAAQDTVAMIRCFQEMQGCE